MPPSQLETAVTETGDYMEASKGLRLLIKNKFVQRRGEGGRVDPFQYSVDVSAMLRSMR